MGKQKIHYGPYVVNSSRAHIVAIMPCVLWQLSYLDPQFLAILDVILMKAIASHLDREWFKEEPLSLTHHGSTQVEISSRAGCYSPSRSKTGAAPWALLVVFELGEILQPQNTVKCSFFAAEIIILTMIRVYRVYRERECHLLDILLQHNISYFATGLSKSSFMAVEMRLIP